MNRREKDEKQEKKRRGSMINLRFIAIRRIAFHEIVTK